MSSTIATYIKDPSAKLDYSIDWSRWLPTGDTISAVTWSASGVTVSASPAPSHASGVATAWLEGGTEGEDATVTCQVTTTAGRIDERSIRVQVRGR